MKTHMRNTQAIKMNTDVCAYNQFLAHKRSIHSKIKPCVDTRRTVEYKVVRNKKNNDSDNYVKTLFQNLHSNKYKSALDNKATTYEQNRKITQDKIKHNKYQKLRQQEHQREMRSMQARVNNCKTLNQRKKDKTDPIVSPAYFMRSQDPSRSGISIQGYCQKVLSMNRPKSSYSKSKSIIMALNSPSCQGQGLAMPIESYCSTRIPNYSKKTNKRPYSANTVKSSNKEAYLLKDELPDCNFKAILDHIIDRKMFKDTDIKVLYVRLCYKYGESLVDQVWEDVMDQLEK